jgi:ribosomal protein L9
MRVERRIGNLIAEVPSRGVMRFGLLAGTLLLAMAPAVSDGVAQNSYPHIPPELNRIPDSNQADQINEQQQKKDSLEAANAERKKQIGQESAKLLKLATELKAEVDKTNKDTLSIGVIRKADEIEKLAHSVKEKMQLTIGAS